MGILPQKSSYHERKSLVNGCPAAARRILPVFIRTVIVREIHYTARSVNKSVNNPAMLARAV